MKFVLAKCETKTSSNFDGVGLVERPQPVQLVVAIPPDDYQVLLAPVVLLLHPRHVMLDLVDGGVVGGCSVPLGGLMNLVPVVIFG